MQILEKMKFGGKNFMQTTRKLLIILMLFLMIFCISGVSASDNADNLTVSQDNIMPMADDEVISSVDEGVVSSADEDIVDEGYMDDEEYPLKEGLNEYSFDIDNKIDNFMYETTFEFGLPDDANSAVNICLGNETYSVDVISGKGKITFNNSELINEDIIGFSYVDEKYPLRAIEIDLTKLNILTRSTDKRMGISYDLVSSSFYFEGESEVLGIKPKDNYEIDYDVNGDLIYVIGDKEFDSIGDVIILIDGEEFYRFSLDDYYLYQEVVGYDYDGTPIYETYEEYGGNFLSISNLGLSYGEHEYQIIYTGNDYYGGSIRNGVFTYDYMRVNFPPEFRPPIDNYQYAWYDVSKIGLRFSPLLTGNIEVLFDNESYLNKSITSSEMYVSFDNNNGLFDMLDVGTHECRIIYSGGNHDDRIINRTFLLDYPFPFNINYESDNSVNYETSFYFDIDDMTRLENGVVTIDLGNKSYRVNLTSDPKNPLFIGNITLSNSEILAADSIIFSVKSPEYPLKKIEMNTNQLNLSVKPQPVLTAKTVTKTYGTTDKLVVYLKDTNGKAISNVNVKVVLNGASKNIKTDSKGKATLALNQAPGKYNAKITYSGAKEVTAKIVVKKATPKITAKAKTFKKSVKTKKYSITLKNNKNKVMKKTKVKLTVNKKTYYATTNSKGVATFKITKLTKKGKYTATVKYGGNKYYNSKTAKPKITIK